MTTSRLVITMILCLALGLSACGRKGALEDPEGASSETGDSFILDGLL